LLKAWPSSQGSTNSSALSFSIMKLAWLMKVSRLRGMGGFLVRWR
jgi:hypothetical protein